MCRRDFTDVGRSKSIIKESDFFGFSRVKCWAINPGSRLIIVLCSIIRDRSINPTFKTLS